MKWKIFGPFMYPLCIVEADSFDEAIQKARLQGYNAVGAHVIYDRPEV